MSESPEYDTIDLPANTTIVITQPLEITHSVQIIGNNATLLFDQGDTAAWPATASGAIYVDTPFYDNIQLDLEDFTIKFDMSSPIRWSNPAGTTPALYDPENNPAGIQHAVIDTGDSESKYKYHNYSFNNLTIYGPPAFDGSSFTSLQSQLAQDGDDGVSIRRRARHGLDPLQRQRQRDDLELDFSGWNDRSFRRSLEHHRQHGAGIDGRHVFAGCVRLALAARRCCRGQPGIAVRSRRPRVPPGRARGLGLR